MSKSRDYYNHEGYADPTAYYAIMKAERELKVKRKKAGYRGVCEGNPVTRPAGDGDGGKN